MIEANMIEAVIIRRCAALPAKTLSIALPAASALGEFASLLLESFRIGISRPRLVLTPAHDSSRITALSSRATAAPSLQERSPTTAIRPKALVCPSHLIEMPAAAIDCNPRQETQVKLAEWCRPSVFFCQAWAAVQVE